jgi:ferredoxin--NADP+ reductase
MNTELHHLAQATIRVEGAGTADDPDGQKKLEALAAIDGIAHGPRKLTFRFGLTPVAFEGEGGRVTAVRFRDAAGVETVLPCDTFISAIGFDTCANLSRGALLEHARDIDAGVLDDGLYATGWFRRGPRGTIPENRAEAQALAARVIADFDDGPGRPGLPATGRVGYAGWKRIDEAEVAAAGPDRCRRKIADRNAMLALALNSEA